jgi:hypothetical protein
MTMARAETCKNEESGSTPRVVVLGDGSHQWTYESTASLTSIGVNAHRQKEAVKDATMDNVRGEDMGQAAQFACGIRRNIRLVLGRHRWTGSNGLRALDLELSLLHPWRLLAGMYMTAASG